MGSLITPEILIKICSMQREAMAGSQIMVVSGFLIFHSDRSRKISALNLSLHNRTHLHFCLEQDALRAVGTSWKGARDLGVGKASRGRDHMGGGATQSRRATK